MLHLHFSNRLPVLTERLMRQLAMQAGGVFDVHEIIVPSAAVQRAVLRSVADTHGICANLSFDKLARWLWRVTARLVPGVSGESPFQPDMLAWQILAVFDAADFVAAHPRLQRYLAASDPVMRYELAQRIATLFDQYITYRSDWLEHWSAGGDAVPLLFGSGAADVAWQSDLWRRLLARLGAAERHPRQQFIEALGDPAKAALLSPAVHLFALPSIPPLYVEWLHAMAGHMEIHLYVLNPCAEYWADIVSERRLALLAERGEAAGHEVGNPLLAAWAGSTRTYFATLIEAFGDHQEDDPSAFPASPGDTLLAQLQNRILQLEDLAPGSLFLRGQDRSLEVHVCHSLTRQLEVVVDRLLGLFAADEDPATRLRPCDVLIAVPELETAAPLVEAVFAGLPESRRIPYSISGRARRHSEGAARTLSDLLALADSRLEADAVMALLALPLVLRRFDLDAERLDRLRDWVSASGYRWGADAAHRERLSLPGAHSNTLEDGMDRLLLAYLMPATQVEPVLTGQLPAAGVLDPPAQDLAALAAYSDALLALLKATAAPLDASSWATLLDGLFDGFMAAQTNGSDLEELAQTRSTVRDVCAAMRRADATVARPLSVVRAALEAALTDPAHGGVPTGSVTVAALSSLRGLPFRVICILGLDDGVFPHVDRPADFDLMAQVPRPGDRQRRADDRNVFLDHLLAAGEFLHLSYTGFSDRTNAPLPASAIVDELLDAVVPATVSAELSGEARAKACEAQRARLVLAHPLQPFASEYFLDVDPRLQSFAAELADALRARYRRDERADLASGADGSAEAETAVDDEVRTPRPLFFDGELADPALPDPLTVEDLKAFYRAPAAHLLERQLRLVLREVDGELPVEEALLPERLRDRALEQRLYRLARTGADRAQLRRHALAMPDAPPGILGETAIARWVEDAVQFAALTERYEAEAVLSAHEVHLSGTLDDGPYRLLGAWGDLRASGLLRVSTGRANAQALLSSWVEHVVLCCAPPADMALVTRHLFRGELATFRAPADPQAILESLVRLYRLGMRRPLGVYPRTSLALCEDKDGIKAARRVFEGAGYGGSHGESQAAPLRLALRGAAAPLGPEFEAQSRQVMEPLVAALTRSTP